MELFSTEVDLHKQEPTQLQEREKQHRSALYYYPSQVPQRVNILLTSIFLQFCERSNFVRPKENYILGSELFKNGLDFLQFLIVQPQFPFPDALKILVFSAQSHLNTWHRNVFFVATQEWSRERYLLSHYNEGKLKVDQFKTCLTPCSNTKLIVNVWLRSSISLPKWELKKQSLLFS